MRVFVTGSSGFVGRWLSRELTGVGHQVVEAPEPDELDIGNVAALTRWFASADGPPEALAHLAGVAFGPDARADAAEAFRVNVGGTVALLEALRAMGLRPPVLVAGSSEVYGRPTVTDLPLTEDSPLRPEGPYALSKCAQEAVAVEAGLRYGFPVVVTRSFIHTGPGQRPVFVVPAMASHAIDVRQGQAHSIRAGNVDVRRDVSDVRDVVSAYRLLLEFAARPNEPSHDAATPAITTSSAASPGPLIVNVASGVSVSIRSIIEQLCELAGVAAPIEVDPSLVRPGDAEEIRGDSSRLRELTGWKPEIPLRQTLSDLVASL